MRIVTGIGQTGGHQNAYQAGPAGQEQQAAGAQERLKDLLARQSAGAGASAGGAGGKPKASLPDDQVGQLAAELANARSRFDVQQVAGKAMRALASLRMTAALCEGRDKAKINRMIARMEKLMKRTRVKIRHLDKEEQLERQKRRAEKEQEQKKAGSLRDELNSRRKKRLLFLNSFFLPPWEQRARKESRCFLYRFYGIRKQRLVFFSFLKEIL